MPQSSIRPLLNAIEKPIAIFLKGQGFRKKGRSFNREAEKGIIQVVNLQSGTFPIGKYEIAGFRESFYGKFTVNLGVAIDEIWRVSYSKLVIKGIWQEYDCTIRTRLSELLYGRDQWWKITNDTEAVAHEITLGLSDKALPWFNQFDCREKILKNYTTEMAQRADLDKALIVFFQDRPKGIKMLQEYCTGQMHLNTGHQHYVYELAESLGVKLT